MMGLDCVDAVTREEWLERVELLTPEGRPFPLERLPERLALEGHASLPVEMRWRVLATGEEHWLSATPRPSPATESASPTCSPSTGISPPCAARSAPPVPGRGERHPLSPPRSTTPPPSSRWRILAVPALADWCSVDVVQPDGTCVQLGVAHTNGSKSS